MATENQMWTLNLDELAAPERDTVIISGETYELRGPKDFTLNQYSDLLRLFNVNTARFSEDEKREHMLLIFRMALVDCPEEVVSDLEAYKLERLMDFFSRRLALRGKILQSRPKPEPMLTRLLRGLRLKTLAS